ncbi:unnamed protein product [Symbiodinium sp. CCMP2592]|nr:unnamed protein product [Symbiodinium sp. CCMP2592]
MQREKLKKMRKLPKLTPGEDKSRDEAKEGRRAGQEKAEESPEFATYARRNWCGAQHFGVQAFELLPHSFAVCCRRSDEALEKGAESDSDAPPDERAPAFFVNEDGTKALGAAAKDKKGMAFREAESARYELRLGMARGPCSVSRRPGSVFRRAILRLGCLMRLGVCHPFSA